jgi:predicted TIM-barrel fold metal-dependent hydrolase
LKNKIALEEHFAIDLTIDQSKLYSKPVVWEMLKANLLDIEQQRLERMEQGGTAFSILSLNSPGTQGIPNVKEAIDVSRRANDVLAEHVVRHPTKLGGFAALPMQDPEAAARELERSIKTLGFHGFMVNGFSQVGNAETVAYYDAPQFADFWSSANTLGKPFYLHPRDPLPSREPIYDGFPWLTAATWAFTMETSTHALRLMSSGLFDRNPNLQMILGHLGECIPFNRRLAVSHASALSGSIFARTCMSRPAEISARRPSSRRCWRWAATGSCTPSITHSKALTTHPAGLTIVRSASSIERRSAARTHADCSVCPEGPRSISYA